MGGVLQEGWREEGGREWRDPLLTPFTPLTPSLLTGIFLFCVDSARERERERERERKKKIRKRKTKRERERALVRSATLTLAIRGLCGQSASTNIITTIVTTNEGGRNGIDSSSGSSSSSSSSTSKSFRLGFTHLVFCMKLFLFHMKGYLFMAVVFFCPSPALYGRVRRFNSFRTVVSYWSWYSGSRAVQHLHSERCLLESVALECQCKEKDLRTRCALGAQRQCWR